MSLPTPRLWVHHTGDDRQGDAAVRQHQAYHMDVKGWQDIAYSFLIGDDGTIYEGRGAGIAGAHTEGDNSQSHAICLLGNFEGRMPTARALGALVDLARHGLDRGWWIPTLRGHKYAPGAATACPGRLLDMQLPAVRALVNTPPQEEDDMPYSRAQMLEMIEQGTWNAIVKGGDAEASIEKRVEEGVEAAFAVKLGVPGLAVDQFHARVVDGLKQALDDPDVQSKLREIVFLQPDALVDPEPNGGSVDGA
jgi:hypothetical protein